MTDLQELESLRTLFEALPDPAFLKDGEGRWLHANAAALEAFGLEGKEYRGLTDTELGAENEFYRDAHLFCVQSDNEAWQQTGTAHSEEVIPRPDGTSRVYDTYKVPLFHPDGRRKGLVILGRDVTHRVELARMRAQFLGVAAHELRTPLTPLLLLLESMIGEVKTGRQVALSSVERILRLAKRMSLLVEELLDAVHLERDALSIVPVQVDLGELIESVAGDFRLGAPGRRIEVERPEHVPSILADPSRVQQLLGNLVSNALKFSSGTVTIRLLTETGGLRVEVEDEGRGIAPDRQVGIFTRFYRVLDEVNLRSPGLGLGLFIAREIARRHGGEIGFQSELGRGSTFYFFLPTEGPAPSGS